MLAVVGAPPPLLLLNGVGLILAFAAYVCGRFGLPRVNHAILGLLVIAALCAVALAGTAVDGVRRWIRIGPVSVHVGFILLPLLLATAPKLGMAFAPAVAVAAGAFWLQPDFGMSLSLSAATLALAAAAPTKPHIAAALVAAIGAGATWLQHDPIEPVLFVEHVPVLAWARHPALGVVAITVMGTLPLALAWRARAATLPAPALAQAGLWLGAIAASFVGDFPSPILGAGISPLTGYALSWAAIAEAGQRS